LFLKGGALSWDSAGNRILLARETQKAISVSLGKYITNQLLIRRKGRKLKLKVSREKKSLINECNQQDAFRKNRFV